ncbi:Gfo/Idh/MocA family oxidoreductase [Neobacillus mesonae]|nr:Gfo/Idh/MocA family oxidoreductase [Neobacillus mesonae]
MNTTVRKRIAIVGLGDIAKKVYLPLLTAHPGVEVVGVMNRSVSKTEEVIRDYRLQKGTSVLQEMLSWDLDAVFVHSSTESHYEIVMACIERGIAVYVDKPLSYDLKESIEMAAFAEAAGVLLAVGFNRRFAPFYREAKAWITSAGELESISCIKHRTKLDSRSSRITVYDDLIHMIDTLLWLSGEDYELASHQLRLNSGGALLQATGSISFGKRGVGSLGMVRFAGADLETIELHGSGRTAVVEQMESLQLQEAGSPAIIKAPGSWEAVITRRGFTGCVQHFLDYLGEDPEACELHAGRVLASHELAEKLLQ